jgi:hypothetical protein
MPPFDPRALKAGVDLIAEPVEQLRVAIPSRNMSLARCAYRAAFQRRSEVILPTRRIAVGSIEAG